MERKTQKVLGFDVDIISFNDALERLIQGIQNNNGMHVITINPEIIETAQSNDELAQIIKSSEMVVADGSGIKLALMFKGINQERIPGVDLALKLIETANKYGYRIALIGAKEEIIKTAEENLKKQYPDINICFCQNGYFSENDEEKIIENIRNSDPDIVLAALGSPKQEFFIKKCRQTMQKPVFIGIGGSFDVWAGAVERAPKFFRIIGCEWLYRTLKQPERLKRIYKTLPMFAIKAIIDAVHFRFQKRDI